MSTNLRNFTKAVYGMDHVVRAVPDDQWDQPSPCEGWNAAEVLLHAAGAVRMVDGLARGEQVEAAAGGPRSVWAAARDSVLEGLDQPGVLQKVVDSPFGSMPVDNFLGVIMVDTLTHTWDVARSVGGDEQLDADLVSAGHQALLPFGAGLRGPGRFSDEIEAADDDDDQARFLKFLGRQP